MDANKIKEVKDLITEITAKVGTLNNLVKSVTTNVAGVELQGKVSDFKKRVTTLVLECKELPPEEEINKILGEFSEMSAEADTLTREVEMNGKADTKEDKGPKESATQEKKDPVYTKLAERGIQDPAKDEETAGMEL
jgi:phage shock protein A